MPNIATWVSGLITLGLGGVLAICFDRIFLWCTQQFYPAAWLADISSDIASNLGQLKKKYPLTEASLETEVLNSLNDAIKKISAV